VPRLRASGREDASAGIVFRFTDGKYDVVRANALEDNFGRSSAKGCLSI
jgi:hypothetical protein